jgi:transposase
MSKQKDRKLKSLKQAGSLNPNAGEVKDELFTASDFFDAHDLVQVKYEMVRRVQVDGKTVSQTANSFGFSRPSFYQAQSRFKEGGIEALVPNKPGPRRSHKLDASVMKYLQKLLATNPKLTPMELADRILEQFNIRVHPRSVERSLQKQKKKPR